MTDEETLRDIYLRYWDYMISKDSQALKELMTEDYYLLHMTGTRQSADEFIDGLMNGTFNYYSAEHDEISVLVTGDEATMTGKSQVVAAVYGGGKHKWRLKGDFRLKRTGDVWKLTSSRASIY